MRKVFEFYLKFEDRNPVTAEKKYFYHCPDRRHRYYHETMNNPLYRLKDFIEWKAFGVCTAIGEKLGIASSRIRLWFIYISFLTLGSPLILYMILAFWMNIKQYIWLNRRNPLRWR